MRVGVLDIGSHSAHLAISDLSPGGPPQPVASVKQPVRLAAATDRQGFISPVAVRQVVRAVAESLEAATAHRVDTLVPFATSAVRDAANRQTVVRAIESATGVRLGFMSGEEEARLTFLAARGWYGWSAGEMLLVDIGGGSTEIARGSHAEPEIAISIPLGAGRLTRHRLPQDPPVSWAEVTALRHYVRSVVVDATAQLRRRPTPRSAVATSRTLTQLARLTGAPRPATGESTLHHEELRKWIPELAARSNVERARLPGISRARAHQSLAGAVVADAVMEVLGIPHLTVCPWALREGILLDRFGASREPALGTDFPRAAPATNRDDRSGRLRKVPRQAVGKRMRH